MSLSITDFWKLVAESRLLAVPTIKQLAAEFAQQKQAAPPDAKAVAQWLMELRAITKYQATVLLAGKAGPFFFGDYKVYERAEKWLPAGSYRALHNATKYSVLMRVFPAAVVRDERVWGEVSANVAVAAEMVSPYLQRYFEAVELPKFKFVVSEDLRGTTLEEKLAKGRLPAAEACRITRLAALGLAQMHSRGRVHGDVRPANLVLESVPNEPNVKLMFEGHQLPGAVDLSQQQAGGDGGVGRPAPNAGGPAPNALAAMADYLAPELATAGRAPDALTDVYALGCTLYCMLAGKPPFAGGDVQQKLARHAREPLKGQIEGVPPPLAQLVVSLMAKKPTVRCQSAASAAEQLEKFVEPAALVLGPPAAPPTLAAYERAVGKGKSNVQSPMSKVGGQEAGGKGQGSVDETIVASKEAVGGVGVKAAGRVGSTAEEILRRRREQKKRSMLIGIAAASVAVAALGGTGIWWMISRPKEVVSAGSGGKGSGFGHPEGTRGSDREVQSPTSKVQSQETEDGEASTSDGSGSVAKAKASGPGKIVGRQQVVADDGKTLWASPTGGEAVSFRCVPPEGQVFLILRPAAMLASDEGKRVFAALGPGVEAQRQAFEKASGFKLEEIERLQITLHNNDGMFPRTSFVVKAKEPIATEALLEKWGQPKATKEKEETYYVGPTWAYYVSSKPEDQGTFAFGDARDVKDVAGNAGEPWPTHREIERMRRATDAERHFTLLLYPQFLFNDDGEPLFAAEREKVRQPLAWLLGDNLQAASVSGHFGNEFYFEVRMRGTLDKEPYKLAEEMRERLEKTPNALEDYFVGLNPPTYWKKLAFRYPGMVRELFNQTRVGVEDQTAVMNGILPASAAHNLVLGGELLVSTAPGEVAATTTAVASTGPKSIADALQLKTSFNFANQSLEFAMRDLAEDVKGMLKGAPFEFAIKILGDDLKIDGITRNQSIRDFDQKDQTVADILTALVRKANPVTTVKDPSEKDQKLVWVIGLDPEGGKEIVLITTRTAAGAKKYVLPGVFGGRPK